MATGRNKQHRILTPVEESGLERSSMGWLAECRRWAKESEALLSDTMVKSPPEGDTFAAAVKFAYFVMSARCVYLHCKSLLEAKLESDEKAGKWFREHYGKHPAIKSLIKLGDWLNLGAIYSSDVFGPSFCILEEFDKTFNEALEDTSNFKKAAMLGLNVHPCLLYGYSTTSGDVCKWQNEVLSQLAIVINDINKIPRISSK